MHPQRRIRESSTRTLARAHTHKRATSHACLRYAPAGSTRLTAPHAQPSRSLANARSLAGSRPHPAIRNVAEPALPAALRCRSGWHLPPVRRSPFALRALFVLLLESGVFFFALRGAGGFPALFLYRPWKLRRSGYAYAPPRLPTLSLRQAWRFLSLRGFSSATLRALGINQSLGGGLCPRPRYARGSLRYAIPKRGASQSHAPGSCLFRLSPRCRSISSSLGQALPGYRPGNYLSAALALALRANATLRVSAGAPFPRLSFRAGPQFPALFPPLATLAPFGLRGDKSRAKARTVFCRLRSAPATAACLLRRHAERGRWGYRLPLGRRAGRRRGTGATRAVPRAAGLFGQVCGARGDGRSCGAGLASPRRAGWGRAKPAVARFQRASLIQPAPRSASSPYKAPPERPTPLFAPRRSARPAARDTDRFLLPPSLGDALIRPHALRTPFAPAPPLRCVALRAPRPQFPWPATHCPSSPSTALFKSRRQRA